MAFGVQKGHYPKIINKLVVAGMVRLQPDRPKVINGLFGVQKDSTTDRFIFDGRRANCYFRLPPHVQLPSPASLTALWLADGDEVFVGKTDVSNMFHRIRVPSWMSQYFGLPALRGPDGRRTWPVMLSLPMGFGLSVWIASSAHRYLLSRALGPLATAIGRPQMIQLSRAQQELAWMSYIDDEGIFSASQTEATVATHTSVQALAEGRLDAKHEKTINPATASEAELLGLLVQRSGWIRIKPSTASELLAVTHHIIAKGRASPHQMSSLLGKWTWSILICRPLLCLLQHVYATQGKGRKK